MESGIIRVLVLRKSNIIKKFNFCLLFVLCIYVFFEIFLNVWCYLFEDKEINLVLLNIENNFCLG